MLGLLLASHLLPQLVDIRFLCNQVRHCCLVNQVRLIVLLLNYVLNICRLNLFDREVVNDAASVF